MGGHVDPITGVIYDSLGSSTGSSAGSSSSHGSSLGGGGAAFKWSNQGCCCTGGEWFPHSIKLCVTTTQCPPYLSNGYPAVYAGCTVYITGPNRFIATGVTDTAGSYCVTIWQPGNYLITVVTPYGQTRTNVRNIPSGTATDQGINFHFISTLSASAGATYCPGDGGGSATVTFGSYGSCSIPLVPDYGYTDASGQCIFHPSLDILPGSTVTATCEFRGRSAPMQSATTTDRYPYSNCPSFGFGYFYCRLDANVWGCGDGRDGGSGGFVGKLPDASVTITGVSGGHGITDINGYCCITLNPPSLGTNLYAGGDVLSYTVSKDRFKTATGTVDYDFTTFGVALQPADGYHCASCCIDPIKDTLYWTDDAGSVTLKWVDHTNPLRPGITGLWWGCAQRRAWRAIPPDAVTCNAMLGNPASVAVTYAFFPDCSVMVTVASCYAGWNVNTIIAAACPAPGTMLGYTISGGYSTTLTQCPPTVLFTALVYFGCVNHDGYLDCSPWLLDYPKGSYAHATITE